MPVLRLSYAVNMFPLVGAPWKCNIRVTFIFDRCDALWLRISCQQKDLDVWHYLIMGICKLISLFWPQRIYWNIGITTFANTHAAREDYIYTIVTRDFNRSVSALMRDACISRMIFAHPIWSALLPVASR